MYMPLVSEEGRVDLYGLGFATFRQGFDSTRPHEFARWNIADSARRYFLAVQAVETDVLKARYCSQSADVMLWRAVSLDSKVFGVCTLRENEM